MKKVCIVMGSDSDLKVMEGCVNKLDAFGVPYDVRIVSAHRTPAAAEALSKNAAADGYGVIIAAAGNAAHLAACWQHRQPFRLSVFRSSPRSWTVWTACSPLFRCRPVFRLPLLV